MDIEQLQDRLVSITQDGDLASIPTREELITTAREIRQERASKGISTGSIDCFIADATNLTTIGVDEIFDAIDGDIPRMFWRTHAPEELRPLMDAFLSAAVDGGLVEFSIELQQICNGGDDRHCFRRVRSCGRGTTCHRTDRFARLTVWCKKETPSWIIRGNIILERKTAQSPYAGFCGHAGWYGASDGEAVVDGIRYSGQAIANMLASILPNLLARQLVTEAVGANAARRDPAEAPDWLSS